MGPRYQCLGVGGTWTWRLLGSNHRELARGWNAVATQELAAADALAVGRVARTADIEITVGADTSWRWILTVDGEPRASSSMPYARRLECLRAVARFRDCAPLAEVAEAPLIRRQAGGTRRGTRESRGDLPLDPRTDGRIDPRAWPPRSR